MGNNLASGLLVYELEVHYMLNVFKTTLGLERSDFYKVQSSFLAKLKLTCIDE